MTDRRANRTERAARRDRRNEPPGQFGDVVDELLGEGGAAQALPPPIIPIVATAESSLDLPPNWRTGTLPGLQAGVTSNLPPLPSSLGSVSGRRSNPSGYTPPPRPTVSQPGGRGDGANRATKRLSLQQNSSERVRGRGRK